MELATQSEFDEVLNRHHNIQYVDAIFTDLCGYVRGKRFPVLEADKIFSDGVLLPFSAFYLDVLGGVTNTMNLGWTDGDPDGVLMPVKNSIKPVPWDSKVLQVLISMRKEQEKWGVIENPAEVDPRNILEKVIKFASKLQDKNSVTKVFGELSKRYSSRKGGYSRVLKAGFRTGDDAPMAVIELVDRNPEAKKIDKPKKVETKTLTKYIDLIIT